MCTATCLIAPLERVRILAQTKGINRPEYSAKISNTALGNISFSIKDQGMLSLWRGNTALLYKNIAQLSLKLMFYDKFKNYFMPYDPSKYSSFQYYFRAVCASLCSMSFSFFLTYPFEVMHTRGAADMSKNGRHRNYNGTF
jgi:solute carrier family 25 (mitochondrial adenine nucleotide translocator), member 4/5/6/31